MTHKAYTSIKGKTKLFLHLSTSSSPLQIVGLLSDFQFKRSVSSSKKCVLFRVETNLPGDDQLKVYKNS